MSTSVACENKTHVDHLKDLKVGEWFLLGIDSKEELPHCVINDEYLGKGKGEHNDLMYCFDYLNSKIVHLIDGNIIRRIEEVDLQYYL